jgi:hypothetical protein
MTESNLKLLIQNKDWFGDGMKLNLVRNLFEFYNLSILRYIRSCATYLQANVQLFRKYKRKSITAYVFSTTK